MSQKDLPKDSGIIHLLPLLIITLVLALGFYFFITNKQLVNYLPENLRPFKADVAVSPATQYQNPFSKDTQYVNPFSTYKNPFDNLK